MKIQFVTGSSRKAAIAAEHLAPFGVGVEHVPLDLVEIQSESVERIAQHKATQAFEVTQRPCLVEDSGFGIDELGGFPGTTIKHLIGTAGPRALCRLADLTDTRACTSTAALVYVDSAGAAHTFVNTRAGTVAEQPQGDHVWVPLWTVYCPPGSRVPLAAMDPGPFDRWQQWWAANSVFALFGHWLQQHCAGDRAVCYTSGRTEPVT